jgi:hypothetical protein
VAYYYCGECDEEWSVEGNVSEWDGCPNCGVEREPIAPLAPDEQEPVRNVQQTSDSLIMTAPPAPAKRFDDEEKR